jgi:3-methyladenine DNA glycosylase AlkD
LATIIAEADQLTSAQLDSWVSELKSWDTNDQLCANLLWKIKKPETKINKWSQDRREFVRRAGIVLLTVLSVKDKQLPDSFFEKYFPMLKKYSADERVYVKKAISWALREIGKRRSESLRLKTIKLAEEIKKLDTPSARWIASDVIRELSKRNLNKK